MNITAPSKPSEDKEALQNVLCLEIFVLRKFKRQGGRVQPLSFDSPQDSRTILTLLYVYIQIQRPLSFKEIEIKKNLLHLPWQRSCSATWRLTYHGISVGEEIIFNCVT